MFNWIDYDVDDNGHGKSVTNFSIFEILCVKNGKKYSDGTGEYMIYLSVPSACSREIITLAKVKGYLDEAKAKVELIFENFPNKKS